jgi:hypothetical protein
LQAVFDLAYAVDPYSSEVDYGHDVIVPPLRPSQAKWMASLRKGRR